MCFDDLAEKSDCEHSAARVRFGLLKKKNTETNYCLRRRRQRRWDYIATNLVLEIRARQTTENFVFSFTNWDAFVSVHRLENLVAKNLMPKIRPRQNTAHFVSLFVCREKHCYKIQIDTTICLLLFATHLTRLLQKKKLQ